VAGSFDFADAFRSCAARPAPTRGVIGLPSAARLACHGPVMPSLAWLPDAIRWSGSRSAGALNMTSQVPRDERAHVRENRTVANRRSAEQARTARKIRRFGSPPARQSQQGDCHAPARWWGAS
jgi:hypothetical protein